MPDSGRARTLLAVLTLLALVILTVDFRHQDAGPLAAVQRGALTLFAPISEGFSFLVRPVGAFVSAVGDVGDLRSRNAELRAAVRDLQASQPAVRDLERENAELRELLGMRERLAFDTVAAEVIGQPPGQIGYSIIIDAGADEGLLPGMAVVDEHGLVGKLTQVVDRHAVVELLSSPDARYAVRVAPSGHTGLMQGLGPRPFRLEMRDPSAPVAVGEEVVTRSFEGSTIPGGLPVGVIAETQDVQTSPRYRSVRPYVDFDALSVVQVITNAERQPSELPSDGGVEPPPGPRPRITPEPSPDRSLTGGRPDGLGTRTS